MHLARDNDGEGVEMEVSGYVFLCLLDQVARLLLFRLDFVSAMDFGDEISRVVVELLRKRAVMSNTWSFLKR